jgi:two-component system sensor histidine kinase HydH
MEQVSTDRGPLTRRTWAVLSVLLTVAMIGMAGVTRTRVVQSVGELRQSQGEFLLSAARESFRNLSAPPADTDLAFFVTRHARGGLSAIAFFGSDSAVIASAGEGLEQDSVHLPSTDSEPPPEEISGGRIRMLSFFRPTTKVPGAGLQWGLRSSFPAGSEAPSVIVIEFKPTLARDLVADADRTFAVAALTGAGLIALTMLYWRRSRQYEQARRRREHESRLALLGEMSAVLAHEIRNPLASLKGNAQLLARRLVNASAEAHKAQVVVAEAERLEALTVDLLSFARSGPMDVRPTDPVELLAACVQEVGREAFRVSSEGAPRSWPMDASRVRQAVVNVLRNAVQASPPGVPAEVRLTREGDNLVFAVQDHGEGIPSGDPERLFTPFHTSRITGTGLGLAVARRIAELHGGTIEASNRDGGALFRIVLGTPALREDRGR